ncbi:MAG: hypothetical protein AABX17_03590 [Nanoarchaeota archaeon]
MLQTLVLEQEFIDKFTEEIIMHFVKEIKEELSFEKEMRRAQREVELEKMRQKFSNYGQQPTKTPIAQRPQIQQPRPIQVPIPLPQLPRNPPIQKIQVQEVKIQAKQEDINFFGKIQDLINDNLVTYIECPGENKNIIIRKAGATVSIPITLKNDEELVIIKSFSEKARIPLIEGMLNAKISNLEISAVVSENAGSSFIIRKNPVIIQSNAPTRLERPMMQFPQPGAQHQMPPAMPPINRPFTPSSMPQQMQQPRQQNSQNQPQKQENKESFWNKKITFGK